MIDQATIDRILATANIVEVISDFVTLRRSGVNYKGLCPFHNEKTPSFVVSPAKGLFKCFGCGKGGNVVHFIMEHEQMNYWDALRWLAHKYNIEIEEHDLTDEERRARSERESMLIVNQFARDYFRDVMYNHIDGRSLGMAYFRNRGLRDDIIKKFELGYSLEQPDALAREALTKGYKEEYLLKTGLCFKREDGQLRDRFRGRVIYPIHSLSGKVIAFGGRVLKQRDNVGKYLNSPESEIYHKSDTLYGIYFSKQAIVRQDRCYLVEGYMDVISMFQSGVENVVASSGTSLTEGQIRLIHRFTNNITVLYDGDSAGIHASLRGIDMLLAEGMNVKVLLLPDGDDPDSFARKHNAAEYRQYMNDHQVDFIRFKTDLLMKNAGDDPLKRASLIQSIIQSISVIPDPIVRTMYVKECVRNLNVEEQLIVTTIQRLRNEAADERAKERFRQQQRAERLEKEPTENANSPEPISNSPDSPTTTPPFNMVQPVNDTIESISDINQTARKDDITPLLLTKERLLVKIIVRYGNVAMYEEEDETGNRHPVTVTEYIAYCMQENELQFKDPLDAGILEEARLHAKDTDFNSEKHFLSHPDAAISCLAAELASDKYQLSRVYEQTPTEEDELYKIVPYLMRNYNLELVKEETKKVLNDLQNPVNQQDTDICMKLMQRYKELTIAENELNKQLGGRVINS